MSNVHFQSGRTFAKLSVSQKRRELEEELAQARKDARWKTGREQEEAMGKVEGLVEALTKWPTFK